MKILQIILVIISIYQVNTVSNIKAQTATDESNKHVVGARRCGFFSEFLGVLGHLLWCEASGKLPVVYWDKSFVYYEPEGWNNIQNAWEYYFEPVSEAKYEQNDYVDHRFKAPNGFFFPWKDFSEIETMRPIAFRLIEKYIKIKPFILDIVEDFYNKNMKNNIVVGIHLRGTNKGDEVTNTINPTDVIKKAQKYAYLGASTGKNVKYLIASDEQKLMDLAKKELSKYSDSTVNGEVINYEAERATGNKTNYYTFVGTQMENGFFAKRGLDVLVEVLLLSKCDYFVHTISNVSTAAICFNPNLIHYQFDGFAKIQELKAQKDLPKIESENTQNNKIKSNKNSNFKSKGK